MKLENNINETITRVCDQFAGGLERYDAISGGVVPPEHVLASFALMELGDVLTMTSETNGRTLWDWNGDVKKRRINQPWGPPYSPPPATYFQFLQRRVDLLIFKGDHTKKDQMEFLCLVEFKVGFLDTDDISKLLDWLQYIDTCPYGAVCTALAIPQMNNELIRYQQDARAALRTLSGDMKN